MYLYTWSTRTERKWDIIVQLTKVYKKSAWTFFEHFHGIGTFLNELSKLKIIIFFLSFRFIRALEIYFLDFTFLCCKSVSHFRSGSIILYIYIWSYEIELCGIRVNYPTECHVFVVSVVWCACTEKYTVNTYSSVRRVRWHHLNTITIRLFRLSFLSLIYSTDIAGVFFIQPFSKAVKVFSQWIWIQFIDFIPAQHVCLEFSENI